MEFDVEILKRQFDDATQELASLNQNISKAIAGIGSNDYIKIDLFKWRRRKNKLTNQLPILESKLLHAQIKQLVKERHAAKAKLETLRPRLEAAASDYDEKLKALQTSFECHAMIQVECFNADQTIAQCWDDLTTKKQELRSLIKSVVDEEQARPDGLPKTDNLLIRR